MSAPVAPDTAGLEALAAFDTPTICNALELVRPERRGAGYITRPFACGFPSMKPVVAFARTARIRARLASAESADAMRRQRQAYYRYIDEGPKPSLVVIQDLDEPAGYGAFWGEVQSAIHRGLGAVGVLTDGSVRDIDQWAPGFQFLAGVIGPSHAYAHLVDFGTEVEVLGMHVRPGDIIHADRHGAVVIPADAVAGIRAAAELIGRREARILAAARAPGFTAERLIQAMGEADEIH
jgi:regulator of RNase E activity RraA